MRLSDTFGGAASALFAAPARAGLTLLAMALGTAAVIVLASVGEGARRYVLDQFAGLGTHLLIVIPGRNETTGGPPPLFGETPRDLTLDDALALLHSRHIARIAPLSIGMAPVSTGSLEREVTILGSTSEFLAVRNLKLATGRFLPAGDVRQAHGVAVLGETLARELFGNASALGRGIRIGDRRFRVIGILGGDGVSLGDNLADLALIPVASAQALFDNPALFRILVQATGRDALDAAATEIRDIVRGRHEGEDDVTVITQDALLGTFDRILGALTLAVSGIAAISLTVAGVLIMNVMLVAVSQRTEEIGLFKALGASEHQVMALFLGEAFLLAGSGTLLGLLLAQGSVWLFNARFADFQLATPVWAMPAAAGVSLVAGLLFGWLPARRAARLDPVVALSGR